jgi:carboxyl-terminal processing protease
MANYIIVISLGDKAKITIGVIFFSALVFGAGFYYGSERGGGYAGNASTAPPRVQAAEGEVDMDTFWQAWSELDEKWVPRSPATTTATSTEGSEDSPQNRVYGAINGMVSSLGDPYTTFLPPTENEVFEGNIEGEFGGVGMEIGNRDGVLTVISPLKGTPAERSGLQPGDKILAVGDTTTENMSVQEAVQRIRGEVGTDVLLTVLSEGDSESREVEITRSTIQVPTIETSQQDGAFVISLYNFSAQSAQLFEDALQEFRESDEDDLVLDLRGNAGGFLQAAVDISSHFIAEDEVIVREDYGDKRDARIHRSSGYGTVPSSTDVAVLVNRGSASASEIFAGALRDNDIAQLVGEQTFGKGSVQELVELSEDTSLKVTVARWLTPDGVSISENGLTPDIVVGADDDDANATSSQMTTADDDPVDVQLNRAIELITGN